MKQILKIVYTLKIVLLIVGCLVLIPIKAYALQVHGTGIVTADSLNVRSGPGKDYDAINKVTSGDMLEVVGYEDGWYKISANGTEGYVSADYLEFEPDEEEIIEDDDVDETDTEEEAAVDDETQDGIESYKVVFGLIAVIVVLLIIILLTIKSIKKLDEEYDEYEEDGDIDYDEEISIRYDEVSSIDYDEDDAIEYDENDAIEYDEDDAIDYDENDAIEYDENDAIDYEEDDSIDYEEDDAIDYDEDNGIRYDENNSINYHEEDDDYEYEHIVIRRPKKSTNGRRTEADDYLIDIDPKYFED